MNDNNGNKSLPVQVAIVGLHHYLQYGKRPNPRTDEIVELLSNSVNDDNERVQEFEMMTTRRAGAFVSYHNGDELRGCIGTIASTTPSVLDEILHNTVAAGTEDPRFLPIELDELPKLTCSVDVLGDAEPIDGMDELDVKRYGVIVSNGWQRGLLLPDLDGVDTPEQQVDIALAKAGIEPGSDYDMQRFEVVRYS
ncbi:MAG: AmmeMemoRadiSam system protein A [Coriobacteriales bacterium]|jgi:AmmeMemoRadiSam system protein A|nr:AmmeMemoRadiSam system protein A [Coriobacteriales bacterium]